VFSVFSDKLQEVKAAVMGPFHDIITDTRFSCIQRPQTAYSRAFKALDRLAKDFEAWRDFVEVARCLQRSFLELLAFADWWHDIQQGEDFRPPFRAPTRGLIYDTKHQPLDSRAPANLVDGFKPSSFINLYHVVWRELML
jgi:hypothetical protein